MSVSTSRGKCDSCKQMYNDCCCEFVFICNFCGIRFDEKLSIEKHILDRASKFTCYKCGVSFCNLQLLNAHNEIEPDVGCCGRSISSDVTITDDGHSTVTKYYGCLYCEESFFCKSDILAHSCIYKARKFCRMCQKSFKKANDLLNHSYNHLMDRQFQCKVCKSNFKLTSLSTHRFIQKRNINYPCAVCNISVLNGRDLIIANNLTSRLKYKCKICKKSFKKSGFLKRHMSQHSVKRKHVCVTYEPGASFLIRSLTN